MGLLHLPQAFRRRKKVENAFHHPSEKTTTSSIQQATKRQGAEVYMMNSLIQQERRLRGMPPLRRSKELDDVAQNNAERCADSSSLHHVGHAFSLDIHDESTRSGGSGGGSGHSTDTKIFIGRSVGEIHAKVMMSYHHLPHAASQHGQRHVLSKHHNEFGLGISKGPDGRLFCCQLYR